MFPVEVLNRYPGIQAGIKELEDAGYPLLVQDASLSGKISSNGCYFVKSK